MSVKCSGGDLVECGWNVGGVGGVQVIWVQCMWYGCVGDVGV